MLDSGDLQTEKNKVSVDVVNKKRTLKSQAQVWALENAYKEQKFPSDEMKAQTGRRQEHSSGVIQDRVSGLRQDSFGSIKKGDYRNIDPREVESRRIYGQEFHSADLKYGRRSHQNTYDDHMGYTSSESSLSLHDQPFSESMDPCEMQISSKLTENRAISKINPRIGKSFGYKPSGYLKVKGETENPAITAVKRQIGRHYKEDGPLLGIQFDPLPPGAFEFPSSNTVNEPICFGNSRQTHYPDISGVIKQPSHNIVDVYDSKISSQDCHMEVAKSITVHGSERRDRKSHHQLKHKSALDIDNFSAEKTTLSDCKRTTSSKLAVENTGPTSFSNHPGPYGVKTSNEQEKPWLHDDDNHTYKALKNGNLSRTSNLRHGYSVSPCTERGSSARVAKVEKLGGEWKTKKECHVRLKTDLKNELRVSKQVDVQFPQQDCMAHASHAKSPLLTNQTKGSSIDVPSSFSEDEGAETDSSTD
ncbi:Homeodomain-like superfamily protein, putative isoform 3 [Hibiscus syriacus]|uniref:Homeodomain-like superfamily protein, putative isoform 3 n=1 Tax=Hibiscus syriacus TaxID=106335 RepID=A0A6A2YK48_HIBSY|nr:Homeodomain-like superfamily protein, putative isoform 3 [Hibiscus syriacus]